jgi:hypothetical protein
MHKHIWIAGHEKFYLRGVSEEGPFATMDDALAVAVVLARMDGAL